MDNKQLIINRAHKLLLEIGPTSMTMDTVARACGMSKRTLYEIFPDKKTLVMECIAVETEMHNKEAHDIFQKASNCFEALFEIYKSTRQHLDKRSQAFIDDVKRLYPEITEHHKQNEKLFISQLSNVLSKAQDEGMVMNKINTDVAAFLFLSQMRSLHKNPSIEAMGFDHVHVYDAAFINFMRGIATIEGIEYIETQIKNFDSNKKH